MGGQWPPTPIAQNPLPPARSPSAHPHLSPPTRPRTFAPPTRTPHLCTTHPSPSPHLCKGQALHVDVVGAALGALVCNHDGDGERLAGRVGLAHACRGGGARGGVEQAVERGREGKAGPLASGCCLGGWDSLSGACQAVHCMTLLQLPLPSAKQRRRRAPT